MAKKSRNKKAYKRIVPKMVKFENVRLKQMLGMIPTPEDNRFSFRKHFQERDTKPDIQMTDISDMCTVRNGMEVAKEIRQKKTSRFMPDVVDARADTSGNTKYNLKKNQFPVWMSSRKQKKIVTRNRKIRKSKLNSMKQLLQNKKEVLKIKKQAKRKRTG